MALGEADSYRNAVYSLWRHMNTYLDVSPWVGQVSYQDEEFDPRDMDAWFELEVDPEQGRIMDSFELRIRVVRKKSGDDLGDDFRVMQDHVAEVMSTGDMPAVQLYDYQDQENPAVVSNRHLLVVPGTPVDLESGDVWQALFRYEVRHIRFGMKVG
jgi:hypothetical protein